MSLFWFKNWYKDCSKVPSLLSAFVDTFVDYTVGGQFLGPQPSESPNGSNTQDGPSVLKQNSFPAPERLIAIGDIHGDLDKAKKALLIAQVMDHDERWIGGETVVVQLGDLLDRGGEEIKIIYLLEKLKREAQRAGGAVHIMTGNHEIMNVQATFSHATIEGVNEFERWAQWYKMGNVLKERCKGLEKPQDFFQNIPNSASMVGCTGRVAALRPGGPITSRFLAPHPVVLVVGGNMFVHGGLLPYHIDYGLDKINRRSRKWMEGKYEVRPPKILCGSRSLVWLRKFSHEESDTCNCKALKETLLKVPSVKRMVMGHTIQYLKGINGVCDNKAVRVDVGMSQGCANAEPEVLEILNDKVMTVLSAFPVEDLKDNKDLKNNKDNTTRLSGQKRGLSNFLNPTSPVVKAPVNRQTSAIPKLKLDKSGQWTCKALDIGTALSRVVDQAKFCWLGYGKSSLVALMDNLKIAGDSGSHMASWDNASH